MKTSSERLAEAMERTRLQRQQQIKADAISSTANLDEFMAALDIVEDDHKLVLEKVETLKDALHCLSENGEKDFGRAFAILCELNEFLGSRLPDHMEEEEKTLFPFLENFSSEEKSLVARLRQDHAEILDKILEFGNCLEVAAELAEDGIPRAVLLDLLAFGFELWEFLDAHAHIESQAIRQSLVCRLDQ